MTDKLPLVDRLRNCAQGIDLGADGMGWSPDPELMREAADELIRLRAQLEVSTRGLKHCAGWNISDDKRNALMAVVWESEKMIRQPAAPMEATP